MSRYSTKEDLLGKCDWEGGASEFILGYGLSPDELPEGTPVEVIDAVEKINAAKSSMDVFEGWLYNGEES